MNTAKTPNVFLFHVILLCMFFLLACGQSTDEQKQAGGAASDVLEASEELKTVLSKYEPTGFVNDFGEYLDEAEKDELEAALRNFQAEAKIDMAIVLIDTAEGHSIDDLSLHLARKWKIGAENGGALLMLAVTDRSWRIQIDRRLEQDLTIEEVKRIGETMLPDLKQNNYAAALKTCTKELFSVLRGKRGFQPF